ncbi:MAG: hypothetical protein ACYCOR_20680 [Acidobacteriaceae bacterium]
MEVKIEPLNAFGAIATRSGLMLLIPHGNELVTVELSPTETEGFRDALLQYFPKEPMKAPENAIQEAPKKSLFKRKHK